MDDLSNIKLTLEDYLSPFPIYLKGVGYIRRPLLEDIANLTFLNFTMFVNMLSMSPEEFINTVGLKEYCDTIPDELIKTMNLYDLIVLREDMIRLYIDIFNFFIIGEVVFDTQRKVFFVMGEKDKNEDDADEIEQEVVGQINRDNYTSLFNLILATNYMKAHVEDVNKIKNKKARAIFEKLEKERAKVKKKKDKDLSFGNIISKVAANSSNVNILNIWKLTLYQLYNEFHEITYRKVSDMRSVNYAFAGGEYDIMEWIKSIE